MGNYGGFSLAPGTTTSLSNSIIAGNTGTDINGAVTTATHTLIGNAAGGHGVANAAFGNLVGNGGSGVRDINTALDTNLADNGGPTMTHALLAGSAAINAGSGLEASNAGLFTDQRAPAAPSEELRIWARWNMVPVRFQLVPASPWTMLS